MHELGVLRHIVATVEKVAAQNSIASVRHITLDVGETSGFVPAYLTKLFPVATDGIPLLAHAVLRITTVAGDGLTIRDIGY